MTSTTSRFGTIVRFLASVVTLLAIVLIVPWLLVAAARRRFGGVAPWHGVPPPADWDWSRARSAWGDQLTDDTLADLLIRTALFVAWLAVVVVVVTVAVEVVHMRRHDGLSMPDVRGLGLAQPVARAIAAGLLVLVPTVASTSTVLARGTTGPGPDPSTVVETEVGAGEPTEGRTPDEGRRHVVRSGESVYAIAERYAGPDRQAVAAFADQLLDLNLGRPMPDGGRFDNPALVGVGWVLELPPTPQDAAVADGIGSGVHIVERGESLWSIAGDELGDPARWPEIHRANAGRTFDDGGRLDDPSHIRPGWDLLVPVETAPGGEPTATADITADSTADTTADTTADVAETGAPVVDVGTPEGDEVATVGDDGGPIGGGVPDHATVTESAAAVDDPRPTNRWTTTADRSGVAPALVPSADEPVQEAAPELLTFGRAAMLSAGVLTLLGVRRRQRLRGARPRAGLPAPARGVAATEQQLRSIDGGDRFVRVDVGVRAAARALVSADERLAAVLVDDAGALELRATGPFRLEPPWSSGADARCWHLAASVPIEILAHEARQVGSPCPTLVQLGRTADDRDLYVDLETIGAIDVGGPGDRAEAVVTAVAATLAASVLAEVTTLVGVGVDDAAFLGHRHHRSAGDVAEAFRIATASIGAPSTAGRSTFELRTRSTGGETWEPAVVLVGAAAGPVALPSDRTGLAVVSASPTVGPSSRLEPDGDAWVLRPLGVRCTPIGLPAADVDALADLMASASAPLVDDVPGGLPDSADAPPDWSADDLTLVPEPDELVVEHPSAPPPPLLVRLLGPVEVESADGRTADFERSKSKELVAWLATHRERSTRTAARTALWELDVRDATFANVVSEARRSLARLVEPPAGHEWVGRTLTEALPLHEWVRTDADVVRAALAAARQLPPAQAIATLRPAVELVVGTPFEGTSYLWPDVEGLASELVLLATSAVAELAGHYLSMGDVDGVFACTGRGLQVLPGHEELIGLRMRAHAQRGDRAGVRLEWEQYERVVTADPWSDGEPSETLVELRRELLAG